MYRAAHYAVPEMRKAGGGAMVNLSSVHGLLAAPRSLVYETLKAAVIGLTRQMAVDYGPDGIRVNAVCPGMIQTERMQRRWQANPETLALLRPAISGPSAPGRRSTSPMRSCSCAPTRPRSSPATRWSSTVGSPSNCKRTSACTSASGSSSTPIPRCPAENAAMPIQRFDFRTDLTNVAVSPPIRNRFRRVALGPVPEVHSHDLGGETFLVMEGQIEFTVADETVVCTGRAGHLRAAPDDARGPRYRRPAGRDVPERVPARRADPHLCMTPKANACRPRYGVWQEAGGGAPTPPPPAPTSSRATAPPPASGRPGHRECHQPATARDAIVSTLIPCSSKSKRSKPSGTSSHSVLTDRIEQPVLFLLRACAPCVCLAALAGTTRHFARPARMRALCLFSCFGSALQTLRPPCAHARLVFV